MPHLMLYAKSKCRTAACRALGLSKKIFLGKNADLFAHLVFFYYLCTEL